MTQELPIPSHVIDTFRQRLNRWDETMPVNLLLVSVDVPGFGVRVRNVEHLNEARAVVGDQVEGTPVYYWIADDWVYYGVGGDAIPEDDD